MYKHSCRVWAGMECIWHRHWCSVLFLVFYFCLCCQSVLPPPYIAQVIAPMFYLMQAISPAILVCFRRRSKWQTSSCGQHCTLFCLPWHWKLVREALMCACFSLCCLSKFYISKYLSFGVYFSLVSGELHSVRGWFERVGLLPACTKAVQKILPGKELDALKNFLQKQPASQAQRSVPSEVHCLKKQKHNYLKQIKWKNEPHCEHVVVLDWRYGACADGGGDWGSCSGLE